MEEWKELYWIDKRYKVSNTGIIMRKEKQLKLGLRKGYRYVSILRKKYSVHRLVAQAFIPNPNNYPEIDHIDGNPENNRVENLRWVTRQQNELNPVTRERISASLKGRIITDDMKIKISNSLKGRKQSRETIEKRRLKLKGRKRPQYIRDILLKANIGRKANDETRKRMRIARSTYRSPNCKKVYSIDVNTGIINEFECKLDAANSLGISEYKLNKLLDKDIIKEHKLWKTK